MHRLRPGGLDRRRSSLLKVVAIHAALEVCPDWCDVADADQPIAVAIGDLRAAEPVAVAGTGTEVGTERRQVADRHQAVLVVVAFVAVGPSEDPPATAVV